MVLIVGFLGRVNDSQFQTFSSINNPSIYKMNFLKIVSCLAGFTAAATNINYGDEVFFQVNNVDSRWLTGGHGAGNNLTFTDAYYSEWILRSTPGDGVRTTADPRAGQCLKYGDIIYLQVKHLDYRWLTGSRGSGNAHVLTRNHLGSTYESSAHITRTYQWIVRSNAGTGPRSFTGNADPAYGHCVQDLEKLFLQNNFMDERWLSGGRGVENKNVITRNMFRNTYETNNALTYTWTVRKTPGDGSRTDGTTFSDRPSTPAPATPAPATPAPPSSGSKGSSGKKGSSGNKQQ